MNIRFACVIFLLILQILPLGVGGSFFIDESTSGAASCVSFQTDSSGGNAVADCSEACKGGFPCSDCGTTCCAQFLYVSSHSLTHSTLEMIRFVLAFESPLAPDLSGPKEPPRA